MRLAFQGCLFWNINLVVISIKMLFEDLRFKLIILGEKVDNKDFKHEPLDTQTF